MNLLGLGVERRVYLNRGSVESRAAKLRYHLHSAVRDTDGQRAALEVYQFNSPAHQGTSSFITGLFIDGQFVDGADGMTIE
jgi:hypothetical protein